MGLADFTKQIAKEVVDSQKSKMLEQLKLAETAKKVEPVPGPPAPAAAPVENAGVMIFQQINAMQRACKEDQELHVLVSAAGETMRIHEIFAPNWALFVLIGFDAHGQTTRVIAPVSGLQVVCKMVKLQGEAKPVRVNLLPPKPPQENKPVA